MKMEKFAKIAIPLIFFLYGSFCMLKSYGYCDTYERKKRVKVENEYLFAKASTWVNPYEHVWQDDPQKPKINPSQKEIKEWEEAYKFHEFNAKRTFEDAKNKVWYIADFSWREKGKAAWIAACSTVGVKKASRKLAAACISILCQYGLQVIEEWDYINEKLQWSEYHFKECEHYSNLLYKFRK